MPSKKRKYNARFPAGRIKKIMQTDEEVGKVAQAVPIIISFQPTPRTLELFVESLMSKAMQVTNSRNAKTLSPSHVKQCILAESRFDFLRDLVKNIPDVSAAEEKEMMSAESSPNSSRFSDNSVPLPPRKIVREDSNSSSSGDVRVQNPRENIKRALSSEVESLKPKIETVTSTLVCNEAIDLTTRKDSEKPTVRTAHFYHEMQVEPKLEPAHFYQETQIEPKLEPVFPMQHRSVIQVNPIYASSPQPSTSTYANMSPIEPVSRIEIVPKQDKPLFFLDIRQNNNMTKIFTPVTPGTPVVRTPVTPIIKTPVTPILNIDFTKNLDKPEIKVLDTAVASIVGVKNERKSVQKIIQRQSSKHDVKKETKVQSPLDLDHMNSGNLQIDEDYDT